MPGRFSDTNEPVPAPPPEHRIVARLDTRTRLLEAAVKKFAILGQDGATVRDICQAAGANLNAVKYHFSDKQGLYVAAVSHAHRAMTEHLDAGPAADDDLSPEMRLRRFVHRMVAVAVSAEGRHDLNHVLMMRELGNPTVATEHVVRQFIEPRFRRLNAILEQLLPPGTKRTDRQLFAFSVVGQCMHYKLGGPIIDLLVSASDKKRLTASRISEHIANVVLAAIEARWSMMVA